MFKEGEKGERERQRKKRETDREKREIQRKERERDKGGRERKEERLHTKCAHGTHTETFDSLIDLLQPRLSP